MGLFGKPPKSSKDQVHIDIEREEEKVKRSVKDAAKRGDKQVCKILAKEIVRSRKQVTKLHNSKAHMNSVQLQMKQQLANLKVAGSLQTSTQVMQSMQALVKIPQVTETMRELSKEMTKAGILEEMLDESMEPLDDDELEEEADEEMEKILFEITAGAIGRMPDAVKEAMPAAKEKKPAEEEEEDVTQMQARLEQLRS